MAAPLDRPAATRKTNPRTRSARRSRRTDPPAPDNRLWLDLNERIGLSEFEPGTCRKGQLHLRDHAGHVVASVDYEANMTAPADACLWLGFCNKDPKTGNRQVNEQNVRMAPTPDGTQWQFILGKRASSRLYLREHARRFKCPAAPRPRHLRGKKSIFVHKLTSLLKASPPKKAPARCVIHIDEMLRGGALRPGRVVIDSWPARVGDGTTPFKFQSDCWNPLNPRLWLYFFVADAPGNVRPVTQEVKLAWGDGALWFLDEGRISAEVVLRNNRFRAPRPPRRPGKLLRITTHQEALSIAPKSISDPRAIVASQPANTGTNPTSGRRRPQSWLRAKLAQARRTASRLVNRIFARRGRKAGVLARARTQWGQIGERAWSFVIAMTMWLISLVRD